MDLVGFEPTTVWMQTSRSPVGATDPSVLTLGIEPRCLRLQRSAWTTIAKPACGSYGDRIRLAALTMRSPHQMRNEPTGRRSRIELEPLDSQTSMQTTTPAPP